MYAIIGHQISYTASPRLHQSIATLQNRKIDYQILDIEANKFPEKLTDTLPHLEGANVTTPYKMQIVAFLDEISDAVQLTQSCNTIIRSNGRSFGENTDVNGILESIRHKISQPLNYFPVIFGSGGAARAILTALMQITFESVAIITRNTENHKLLSKRFEDILITGPTSLPGKTHLWFNATPMGGPKLPDFRPIRDTLDKFATKDDILFDLNYQPRENPLQHYCSDMGMAVINGWPMLIFQALAAQKLWFPAEDWNHFPTDLLIKRYCDE
jgi:shikimate dehydrogenase